MNAGQLRALERLEADALYLNRLMERTLVEDAQVIAPMDDCELLNAVRQVQSSLVTIHFRAKQAQEATVVQP